ncbi:exodeoxyribonuclease VII small subunit [Candidatus Poribacteria bacterium]|nr:MAG: exodeoxyribonuclease VII small subunit [Candidatus Poribacteria bacterium]
MILSGKEKLLTFEEKLERLKEIVETLEAPDTLELDASLTLFEEGVSLVRSCRELLDAAEVRVQNVSQEENGDIGAESIVEDENGV